MKNWMYALLWQLDTALVAHRISEALREVGVLWLVFAMLDKLVTDDLSGTWIATHCSMAVASWTVGMYIELVSGRRQS